MGRLQKSLESQRDPLLKGTAGASLAAKSLEVYVSRFDVKARRAVRRLAATSSRVADLATVFPGAAYALATKRGSTKQRRKALELVENGALLKDVARALELPLWLRRLPPEAFRGELGPIPQSEVFSRRIVNHLPRSTGESTLWLGAVLFGARACDEYFALWLADQPLYHEPGEAEELLAALAAYAWYSGSPTTRAHSLIVVPWRPEMALDTALCAAKSWINRIRLVLQLRPGTISDPWLAGGESKGFTFHPLVEQSEILAEAKAMHNCADQYADRLARERCRLFSVRRNGLRVATLEVGQHPREGSMLTITQLKSRHNMLATSEIWQAAYSWLAAQRDLRRIPAMSPPERPLSIETWQSLMLPYRLARRGASWMPEDLSQLALSELDSNLCELARRGGVSSWLFT